MNTTDTARLFDRASTHRPAGGLVSSPDLDGYRRYLAHLDLPEARKDDMMLAVWRMMQSFVDRAFGDDPVQQSGRVEDKTHVKDEPAARPVIDIQHSLQSDDDQAMRDEFRRRADGETDNKETS